MTRAQTYFVFLGVAAVALAAGIFFRAGSLGPSEPVATAPGVLDATLADAAGGRASLAKWKGKVMVVNFWATWCPPCLKEIPDFVRMQTALEARGVQFVGIAVDDMDKVVAYAKQVGINYPLLVGELDAMNLAKALGNDQGGLPYTVVLDRQGRFVGALLGGTTEDKLRPVIEPLL